MCKSYFPIYLHSKVEYDSSTNFFWLWCRVAWVSESLSSIPKWLRLLWKRNFDRIWLKTSESNNLAQITISFFTPLRLKRLRRHYLSWVPWGKKWQESLTFQQKLKKAVNLQGWKAKFKGNEFETVLSFWFKYHNKHLHVTQTYRFCLKLQTPPFAKPLFRWRWNCEVGGDRAIRGRV